MNSDDKGNETDNMMRQGVDDDWEKTIIAIDGPYRLRDLCSPEGGLSPRESIIANKTYKIRLALSGQNLIQANRLIEKKFSWPGYSTTDFSIQSNPNRIALLVEFNNSTNGTITLCFDAAGALDADGTYKAEIDCLRANSKKLAEVTNFSIDENINNKRLMGVLFHIAYIYARIIHRCTDFVIEVKVSHARFYEKRLEFVRCGPERSSSWTTERVVLLRLDLDHMGKRIGEFGGSFALPCEKTLYPYFLSKEDESGIANRLMGV